MKLVHSFWSKPTTALTTGVDHRSEGGWLEIKFHFYSWSLSVLRALKYYQEIELVTDKAGYEMIISRLRLPYTKVRIELDELNGYGHELWAIGKIFSYALQTKPFIHLDSDVYFARQFSEFKTSPLIAQNIEYNLPHNHKALSMIEGIFQLPSLLGALDKTKLHSSNAGIIGGTRLDFFKLFARTAFDFIEINRAQFKLLSSPAMSNLIFEQLLFHTLATREKIPISYLYNYSQPNPQELVTFYSSPYRKKYIHLFGSEFKKNAWVIDQLGLTLRHEFPIYYYRINELINEF